MPKRAVRWRFSLIGLFIAGASCVVLADEPDGQNRNVKLGGTLIPGGVECQLFEADSGEKYTLVGNIEGFKNGDRVKLSGKVVEISFCMQGITLSVNKMEALDTR